jgi:hypothetical protein
MPPQPNTLSHVDRVLRLLHTAKHITLQTQEHCFKAGAMGFCIPFFTRRIPVKVIQDNFAELFALMQAIRLK